MAMTTTMIIAEKPDAASHIAAALAEGRPAKKISEFGVEYWEFERGGKKHIVVAAVGHLFNLKQVGTGWKYPVFDVQWVPSFKARKQSAFSEKYFKTLESFEGKAKDYIVACDFDNEGTVIGANILQFIFHQKDAKRMKFSTLTKPDLIESYEHMMPHLDFQNLECGLARHHLDFYYGVNTSRALTLAIKKNAKRFAVLSAGRVQGPVLCMLAEREAEISKFKPDPYWQVQLPLNIGGLEVLANYEKERIWKEDEAKKLFAACKGKPAVVDDVVTKQYKQAPPVPFNITSLQTEAYRLFGYSPQQTMAIAQKLYTSAHISYPRTSSEKLPPQIDYKGILQALSKIKKYEKLCKTLLALPALKPTEGKRTDPAHEAIHPTVEPPRGELGGPAAKIYDLICRRYLTNFAKEAMRESMQILLSVAGHKFSTTGRRTIEKGWMEFYGPYAKFDEIVLPELKKGDKLTTKKLDFLSKQTAPPPRWSQAAMIKEMEKRELGTRATRAAILQTLYDRKYVLDKSVRVTDLGMSVANTLKKYVPDLVDEKLSRKFDKELEDITQNKIKKERVLEKAKKIVTKICDEFRENEDKIGSELGKAVVTTQEDANTLGPCPNCGANLKVLFSPWTKKSFVGCSNYSRCAKCNFTKKACKCKCSICGGEKGKCKCEWKAKEWKPTCSTGYPLPAMATIQRLDKICDKCKTPMIQVVRKGKRPFRMCLDPKCETKADWGKPRAKKGTKKKTTKK